MKKNVDVIELSATDLVGHLNCQHLTELDLSVAAGTLNKPKVWDPLLEILRERGRRHEDAFVEHQKSEGLDAVTIDGVDITPDAVAQTREAMAQGVDVIIQGALKHGCWAGRADILRRVETPSDLGAWSYEIIDTKLARETKAGSVLQLCLYADLLAQVQGKAPENVYVVAPWSNFEPQVFRFADYAAYFRKAKAAIEDATINDAPPAQYPEPKEHCDICRWRERCEQRRRDDDHLCLVAGLSKNQTTELHERGITTATALAAIPLPLPWKPKRGAAQTYEKVREQPTRQDGEEPLDAALRIAAHIDGGILPIQGPPGTGKTHTGAHMICRLVENGKKVGITANSHKVIRNLLDKVVKTSKELGVELTCMQKPGEREPDQDRLIFAKKNEDVFDALASGQCQVAGGTSYAWSRADAADTLDVLFVDEAAQMSLANVLAVSQSAKTVILLGDPQQLDQPTQGSHPGGTDVSALEHILGDDHTISPERGLFLETTWRLHPEICAFNSELFYDEKLHAKPDCAQQTITANGPISGGGLRYLPVPHSGNQSYSIEEAEITAQLVTDILASNPIWTDREGKTRKLTLNDILVITPYNAQVFEIQQRLPGARVGTVDKFQGQEAPIAIYSMATSSYADAPRGMEFLYSANRFNVAISRAQCVAILIASPEVFEADCKTPRQMQLPNAFCRYLEIADEMESAAAAEEIILEESTG